MKRSEQFELFHRYYEAENERFESLTRRATIYLSVMSGLSLFAGLKVDELYKVILTNTFTTVLSAAAGLFVLMCLAATVLSLRVYPYKDVCDIEEFLVEIDEQNYSDEDIYSLLLANLADAARANRLINDKRARYLEWSSGLLAFVVGTFIVINVAVVALYK